MHWDPIYMFNTWNLIVGVTLFSIMLKNGQIYFKILWYKQRNIFKVYLAIFQQYAIKEVMNVMTVCNEYIQSK